MPNKKSKRTAPIVRVPRQYLCTPCVLNGRYTAIPSGTRCLACLLVEQVIELEAIAIAKKIGNDR